jgi:thermitase
MNLKHSHQLENIKSAIFKLFEYKKRLTLTSAASLFALGAFGLIGCNASNPENNGSGQTSANNAQGKNIPVISAPAVNYNFYKPTTEEALKQDTNYGYLIAKARPGFKETTFNKFGMKVVGRLEANGAVYYRLFAEGSVMGALKDAKKIGGLMYIEPELKYYLHDVTPAPIDYNMPDPYIAREQWGAYASKAYDAWIQYGFGPNRPFVAAIDSGVRFNHDDLTNVVKHAFTWWNDYGWDYHPDIDQTNLTNNVDLPDYRITNPYFDFGTDHLFNGHGTHTSGTICAEGNNGLGVAGVCWNVDFISYRGFDMNGSSTYWSLYGSLWHLANWKTKNNYTGTIPVNASFGSLYADRFSVDMVEYALEHGVMVVASTGNDFQRLHNYPAAYQGVMAIGASDGSDKRATFSTWGQHVSVVAPGDSVISTYVQSNTSYVSMSGTSMAAPHVTGLIGYMLTFNPDLKPDQIKTYIEQNADYINGQTDFSEETGWGRINVLKTIEAVINDYNASRTPPSNYVYSPVRIKVPVDNLVVNLYRCDAQGKILNYVASSVSVGNSEVTDAKGFAYFNLLRPGHYMATGSFAADAVGRTGVFEVKAGQTMSDQELVFDRQFLTIQTMATMDWADTGGAEWGWGNYVDTEIWIYDSETGEYIYYYDVYYYDTLMMPIPDKSGEYWIRITDFESREYYGDEFEGEYAMWVTTGEPYVGVPGGHFDINSILIAPGTYASPLPVGVGVQSDHSQSRQTAQSIDFDKLYYGRFNGPEGTSGTTGHYYKFIVE